MKRLLACAALGVVAFLGTPAVAQTPNVKQAKMLFNAGAAAYAGGQFKAAVQAFQEAYRLYPKPALIFSIAQAQRRQYFIDRDPGRLRDSIERYRAYLQQVPQGGRRADAAEALAELEPIADRMAGTEAGLASRAEKASTRLMIMSQTDGATVSLDGQAAQKTPLAAEVKPGPHQVRIQADGYRPDVRNVLAVEGTLVPVDVTLQELPAMLAVGGPSGAEVSVDGRPVGRLPMNAPVPVPPGRHLVVISKGGHQSYAEELTFKRAERRTIDEPLRATTQRKISYGLMVGGGALALAGGAFGLIALKHEGDAADIRDARLERNITEGDRLAYETSVSRRDDWAVASYVTIGVGGAALVSGVALYFLDAPELAPATRSTDSDRPDPKKPPQDSTTGEGAMEVSVKPFFGPGGGGAGLVGRF